MTHTITIVPNGYFARCRCGWMSTRKDLLRDAEAAGLAHVREAK